MEEQFQDLFRITHHTNRVEAGKLLIAEPFMQGGCFARSVVYLVEHNAKGSVGLVLNKPLGYTTSALVQELEGMNIPVYMGGPVEQNQLYYIHSRPDIAEASRLNGGVYWGGDFKQLSHLLRAGEMRVDEIRFFVGYSGWSTGQLRQELKEGSWMVGEMEKELLFSLPNEGLWESSTRRLGGKYRLWANFPPNPVLN